MVVRSCGVVFAICKVVKIGVKAAVAAHDPQRFARLFVAADVQVVEIGRVVGNRRARPFAETSPARIRGPFPLPRGKPAGAGRSGFAGASRPATPGPSASDTPGGL